MQHVTRGRKKTSFENDPGQKNLFPFCSLPFQIQTTLSVCSLISDTIDYDDDNDLFMNILYVLSVLRFENWMSSRHKGLPESCQRSKEKTWCSMCLVEPLWKVTRLPFISNQQRNIAKVTYKGPNACMNVNLNLK